MDPLAGAISFGQNAGNMFMQQQTNSMSASEAHKNRMFQDLMSGAAHQREVRDLQLAGLNPNLSAGGNGSSAPSGNTANFQAPQISMPDFMAYGIQLKQLEQADQKIAIDKANSAAGISKSLSEEDLNKMKKILAQKGLVRADLEGEASGLLRKVIKLFKMPNVNANDAEDKIKKLVPKKPDGSSGFNDQPLPFMP